MLSFSSYSTNKTPNIYVLRKDFVQGINHTTIYPEKIYKTNFTEYSKFVLSLHYNGVLLCVGNISSDWSLTNSTKTGLYGNVYDFAVDYVPLNVVKAIYDIHRYLVKKHGIT